VVEAVVESLAVKHKVLREIEAVVRGFIFATNTSSLRSKHRQERAARGRRRPAFLNPSQDAAGRGDQGPLTSQETVATRSRSRSGSARLRWCGIPGFLVNGS